MAIFNDLTGKTFGRLTVISRAPNRGKKVCWNCVCECGGSSITHGWTLTSGKAQGCGCLRIERLVRFAKQRKETNPEIIRCRRERYKRLNRSASLLRKYGISLEEFERLKEQQNGRCAICSEVPKVWNTDHNHESGKVRELLCGNCNAMIGMAREREAVLLSAIEYLRRHS